MQATAFVETHVSMPFQDGTSGSHSNSLAGPRRIWYITNWLATHYIWKLSTVGLANLTKQCMGLRKGERQYKVFKWNGNNSNNFTSTGSLLVTDSVISHYRYVPSHEGHTYLFQKKKKKILLATGQWSLLVHGWNILIRNRQPKPVTA